MEIEEAVSIIEEIIQSLKNNPNQFHISVMTTGQKVTSCGGTGLKITATGGDSGSTTIGQKVSLNGSEIQISQDRSKQAIDVQFNALLQTLHEINEQLQTLAPDKNVISKLYDSLKNNWVPGIIISVVHSVLKNTIGL